MILVEWYIVRSHNLQGSDLEFELIKVTSETRGHGKWLQRDLPCSWCYWDIFLQSHRIWGKNKWLRKSTLEDKGSQNLELCKSASMMHSGLLSVASVASPPLLIDNECACHRLFELSSNMKKAINKLCCVI